MQIRGHTDPGVTTGSRPWRSPWIERWIEESRRDASAHDASAPPAEAVTVPRIVVDELCADLDRRADEHDRRAHDASERGIAAIRWIADEHRRAIDAAGADATSRVVSARNEALRQIDHAGLLHVDAMSDDAADACARVEGVARDAARSFEAFAEQAKESLVNRLGGTSEELRAALLKEAARLQTMITARISEIDEAAESFGTKAHEERAMLADAATTIHVELADAATTRRGDLDDLVARHTEVFEQLIAHLSALADVSSRQIHQVRTDLDERRAAIEQLVSEKVAHLEVLAAETLEIEDAAARRISALQGRAQSAAEVTERTISLLEQSALESEMMFRARLDDAVGASDAIIAANLDDATADRMAQLEERAAEACRSVDEALDSAMLHLDHANATSVAGHGAAMDQLGAAWIARIAQAGKRRRAAVIRRRVAPPATLLAAGTAMAGAFGIGGSQVASHVALDRTESGHLLQHDAPVFAAAAQPAGGGSEVTSRRVDAATAIGAQPWEADTATAPPSEPPAPPGTALLDSVLSTATHAIDLLP